MPVFSVLLGAVIVSAVLTLSACTGTGRFSATAICERSGGDYVAGTCEHRWTPDELAAKQWCETHGGVFLGHDSCEFGSGGP
jgi:hypothetical protein